MNEGRHQIMRWRMGVGGCTRAALLAVGVLAITLATAALAAPAANAVVAKGIVDAALEAEHATSAAKPAMIREIDRGLGATWVRLTAHWSVLEPQQGAYAPAELERLDALVAGLHEAGVKVMLTVVSVPAWAQDQSFWEQPPAGFAKGAQGFYAPRSDAMDDFGRLAEFLAHRYRSRIQALECWNEPNLWAYLYPQRVANDPYSGARVYLRMLRSFSAGVRRAHSRVRVVAGATAPVGLNDSYRTSPQRFARFLRRADAGRLFDAYSHHPYTPGGSLYAAPGRPPNDPSTTVTLYNLRTLLRLFPRKPFYLTEYGYSTKPTTAFGGFSVTEQQQARYLKGAFRLAASYPQVKLLTWFLLRDLEPASGPGSGVYSGLRRTNGERKPAWYAFRAQ